MSHTKFPGLVLILVVLASSSFAAGPMFLARADYPIQPEPGDGAIGDFNADGITDLVTFSYATNSIGIVLGNGDGSFQNAVWYPGPSSMYAIHAGRINNDQYTDLLIRTSNSLYIVLNDDGTGLTTPTELSGLPEPYYCALVDLDNDTDADLVYSTVNWTMGDSLAVCYNSGGGVYSAPDYVHLGRQVQHLCYADIDGDTYAEMLLTAENSNELLIVENNLGTLTGVTAYAAGDRPTGICASDFDGDLAIDLATVSASGDSIVVRFNDGSGDFTTVASYPFAGGGWSAHDINYGDFDNDGDNDIITLGYYVYVLENTGSGNFVETSSHWAGDDPLAVFVAQLDGKHNDDIVVLTDDDYSLDGLFSIFLSSGSGTFADNPGFPATDYPWGICAADADGDNDLDIISTDWWNDSLIVYINDGTGNFTKDYQHGVSNGPWTVNAADLDNDNDPDLVIGHSDGSILSLMVGNGNGTFGSPSALPVQDRPYATWIGFMDGDAYRDIVAVHRGVASLSVLLNNGDATFGAATNFTADNSYAVSGGDFNGDTYNDIVVAGYSTGRITILENDGSGSLSNPTYITVGDYPYAVYAGDLDNDGDNDIAVGFEIDTANVAVIENLDNTGFAAPVYYKVGIESNTVTAADLTDDGLPELIVVNEESNNVSILINEGSMAFADALHFGTGPEPYGAAVGDFDLDGDLDIAVSGYENSRIHVLENLLGSPLGVDDPADTDDLLPATFTLRQNYPNPFNPSTTIEYDLPVRTQVTIRIYDILGREVTTLVNREQPAGPHQVMWNGTDGHGSLVASGIYFYRLETDDVAESKKMILLK